MLTLLHLSDLHLGWAADFLDDQAEQFSRRRDGLLHRICTWVLSQAERIDLVLLVGDLFDTHRPSPGLVESVLADLRSLVASGITVVTVPGNHDEITYHDSVYQRYRTGWPGLLVTNPMPDAPLCISLAGQDVYIYSLAYTGGLTRIPDYLSPLPRTGEAGVHIGAFHGSLDWQSGERGLPLQSAALAAAGYDYVALGHFHSPRLIRQGKTTIAYSGMIEGKGFSDPGCGQLTLVDFQDGRVSSRLVPWAIPACRVERVDLSQLEQADELDELISAWADPGLLLRVELVGTAGWLPEVERVLGRHRHGFLHLEVADDSLFLDDQLLFRWANETTIRGQFVRRLLDRLSATDDQETRTLLQLALRRGIAAFRAGGE